MGFDAEIHHRRSIRLCGYDYAGAGAYFLTVCTQGRECLFGTGTDGAMCRNAAGDMVRTVWDELPTRFPHVVMDVFVVMPNHVHGIVIIDDAGVGAPLVGARFERVCPEHPEARRAGTRPAPTLGDIVGAFKSLTTTAYVHGVEQHGWPPFPGRLWQRNYHERIIRHDGELAAVRDYIAANPLNWLLDPDCPTPL